MRVDDFDYPLPDERIAQRPLPDRGASRLLVIRRKGATLQHAHFAELASFLPPRPLLVLNDTAVIPARLLGNRQGTGGRAEVLLLHRIGYRAGSDPLETTDTPGWGRWQALVTASKKIRPGTVVLFGEGARATVVEPTGEEGAWIIELFGSGNLADGLARIGAAPLPPYIRRQADADDRARYQTVFARQAGAVAAPTAGLHFTPEHLAALEAGGAELARVTLHVGAGTFLPVRVADTREHKMHRELFDIPEETARAVARARAEKRAVIAVGTTSLRALESAATADGVAAGPGETELFITPGFRFQVVDHLITNFHAPRSTLLMLVAAFAGLPLIRGAYQEALANGYRFLSYGDATLIL